MEVKRPAQHILLPTGLITAQAGLGHLAVVEMTSFLCWKVSLCSLSHWTEVPTRGVAWGVRLHPQDEVPMSYSACFWAGESSLPSHLRLIICMSMASRYLFCTLGHPDAVSSVPLQCSCRSIFFYQAGPCLPAQAARPPVLSSPHSGASVSQHGYMEPSLHPSRGTCHSKQCLIPLDPWLCV